MGGRFTGRRFGLHGLLAMAGSGLARGCFRCNGCLEPSHSRVRLSRQVVQDEEQHPDENLLDERDHRPDDRLRREAELRTEADARPPAGEVEALCEAVAHRRQHLQLDP
jgi:hypothetical protein